MDKPTELRRVDLLAKITLQEADKLKEAFSLSNEAYAASIAVLMRDVILRSNINERNKVWCTVKELIDKSI